MSIDRTRDGRGGIGAEARPDAEPAILKCDGHKLVGCTLLVLAHRAESKGWASALVNGRILDLCPACRRAATV